MTYSNRLEFSLGFYYAGFYRIGVLFKTPVANADSSRLEFYYCSRSCVDIGSLFAPSAAFASYTTVRSFENVLDFWLKHEIPLPGSMEF